MSTTSRSPAKRPITRRTVDSRSDVSLPQAEEGAGLAPGLACGERGRVGTLDAGARILTPGAQVAAAIDILTAIETGDRPADDVAADYFRRRRYIGAKDRAHIAGHVYAVLRHRAALDWWIAHSMGVDDRAAQPGPRELLVLFEGWRPEAVAACCDGDRFRPARLSRGEERLVRGLAGRTLRHPEMPRAVANDLPEWLEPHLDARLWQGLEREMAALNAPAPTDLRVNLLKADRETARRALAAEGVPAEPTPLSPHRPAAARARAARQASPLQGGLVEVQDEGSQIAALLADARPGMRVVDFCAGAGGKTLALAAGMANRGKLVACEVSLRRLERAAAPAAPRRASTMSSAAPCPSEHDKWVKRHTRRLRPGLRRCALPRHRHLAAQPRCQMARAARTISRN